MARCKQCGVELGYRPLRKVCSSCMQKWITNREKAFKQAVSEIGPLNAENLTKIQKRVKFLEKQMVRESKKSLDNDESGE